MSISVNAFSGIAMMQSMKKAIPEKALTEIDIMFSPLIFI